LVDTLPAFLRYLAEALTPKHPRASAVEGNLAPEEHGSERARITRFGPEDLMREYQILRDVVLDVLGRDEPLTAQERGTIVRSIDAAMLEAANAYFLVYASIREKLTMTLTHDLRTPLTAAKASAELILRKAKLPEVAKWAARIVENLERADAMIRDLLDASRVRAGEPLPIALAECELADIVYDAVTQLQSLYGDRFVVVTQDRPRGWWSAEALQRAIENIAANAVKYGSPDKAITLTVRSAQGRALIQVHNHGSYIPPDQRAVLFQGFQRSRLAEVRGKPRWGIGLSLARGVLEAHGGSVGVDSLPETGTTFTLDLPLDARQFRSE
jgi:signal transduction histidine kinase